MLSGGTATSSRGIHLISAVLGDGLLTAEGDRWLRQRRLMQPASHRELVAAHAETMVAPEGR
jgi:cytochrome P450